MSRLQKMLAKSADIKGTNDIDRSTVRPSDIPKTGVGMMAQLSTARARIQELEESLSSTDLPVDAISPNPWQPRRVFAGEEIQKLANSIAELGLIQPIVVRSVGISIARTLPSESVSNTDTQAHASESVSNTDTRYELVAGERRLRAHKLIRKGTIKAIVVNVSNEDMAAMALAENIDREDLTDFEIANAIKNAEDGFPTRKSLAQCLGIQRTELYQYLAFFHLPDFVLTDLNEVPSLLGRNAAESIKTELGKHGDKAIDSLRALWPRVKSGNMDQGKIAATIESAVTRGDVVKTNRDIKKLFVGKDQAGSITRDAAKFQVTIKTAALPPEKEAELRAFVEKLFA
jgi:ParB family chromosome partitioning protein